MGPSRDEITVPLDEWMETVGERIAAKAADEAIRKHNAQCPIRHVEAAVFGNGDDGLDKRVDRIEQSRGFIRSLILPAIVAAVVAIALALLDVIGLRHK